MPRKRSVLLPLLLTVLTTASYSAAFSIGAGGAPYWVKPGALLEYKAQSYHPFGGGFIVLANGTGVAISGPNVTVLFRITKVTGGFARVNVSISVSGSSKYPVYVIYPSNATFQPFWSNGSLFNMTTTPNNLTKVLVRSLTVGGEYAINLTSGWVYDLRGKPYGHTVLWDGFKPNETFALYNGKKVGITEVRVINATIKSYYSTFPKPNIIVHSEHVVSAGTVTFFDAFYSPEYDVCISFIMDPVPDLNAIGVYGFEWTDDMASSINEELLKKHGDIVDGIWAQGVILANASLGTPVETHVSPPGSSGLICLPVLSSMAIVGVLLLEYKNRG